MAHIGKPKRIVFAPPETIPIPRREPEEPRPVIEEPDLPELVPAQS